MLQLLIQAVVAWNRYQKLSGVGMIMWPVGSLVVVGGILILLLNDPPDDEGYHDGVLQAPILVVVIMERLGRCILTYLRTYWREFRIVGVDEGSIEVPAGTSTTGSVKAM